MARILDAPIAIIDKRRPRDDAVEVINVIGDVAGLKAVIVDDLISTGSTLAGAAQALRDKGATGVDVVTTHGVFTEGSLQRLHEAPIDEICVTDTIPFPNVQRAFDDAPKLRILSVAPLIAEAIVRVHEGRSVSELFK
jgi:ribose-phosphate pyrophosphokinase